MKKSYANSVLRKYKKTHPWARKLPKSMSMKKDRPIDLGVIDPANLSEIEEAHRVGDGSWAIVYDESREGEWLWDCASNGGADHICNVCRYTINTDFHVSIDEPRCPRCGANMTGRHGIEFTDNSIVVY